MKKGFTLVEILATIIILGIIAVIAYTNTSSIERESKEETLKLSAISLIEAADKYYADMDYLNFPEDGLLIDDLDIQNTSFKSGKIILDEDGNYYLYNVTDNNYCINGTKNNLTIAKGQCN